MNAPIPNKMIANALAKAAMEPPKADWKRCVLDAEKAPVEPDKLIICSDEMICSRGNICTIVGAPKTYKTTLLNCVIGGVLNAEGYLGFDSPSTDLKILWIDTEQGAYHAAVGLRRILQAAGLPDNKNDERLMYLATRPLAVPTRLEVMKAAIREYKPDILCVDGAADLCENTNDVELSQLLVQELMTITTEAKCGIVCVLHTNYGSDKPRGHLGTNLLMKSESVLIVKRDSDSDIFTLSPQVVRNARFAPIRYKYNPDTKLPEVTEPVQAKAGASEEVASTMEPNKDYSYSELLSLLCERLQVKSSAAKQRIKRAVDSFAITKTSQGKYVHIVPVDEPSLDIAGDVGDLPY